MVVLAGIVAAVVVAVVWPREREPEYKGKRLSEWLTLWEPNYVPGGGLGDKNRRVEAQMAVRHIGTNALPWLLRWVRYEQPAWKGKAYSFMEKMPPPLQIKPLMNTLDPFPADRPDHLVVLGFLILAEQPARRFRNWRD